MKHRILIISTIVPYPPDRGHRIRIYHLIKQLLTSFRVGLITMAFTDEEYQNAERLRIELPDIEPCCIIRSPSHENRIARIKGVCSSVLCSFPCKPREIFYHTPDRLRNLVEDVYRSFSPHLIQCVYWFTRNAIPKNVDSPVWIDSIDIHWRRARSSARTDPGNLHSLIDTIRARIIRAYEIAAYESVDRVLAIQDSEATILSSVISTPVSTLPVSCTIPEKPLDRNPESVVCFIGPMDYHPNRDAVRFLAEMVMPRVREHTPDARLRVIGKIQGSRSLPKDEWVEYTGHISDLDSVIRTVAVGVAPVRYGAGVNVKVITMLGRGLPLVATGNAVEGLALRDGIDYIRAENADGFANGIIDLLVNSSRAGAIAASGYTFARSFFAWDTNTSDVVGFYRNGLLEI